MNRRDVLKAAPVGLLAALAARGAGASVCNLSSGSVPFLHVLDSPIPGTHHPLKAGDMVLVTPGIGPWDDMHLLRDGRFAAVQVFNPVRDEIGINVYGSADHFWVSESRAEELIAGRVVKRIRFDRGRWIA